MALRTTQPYRRGPREPGAALTSMLRGSTAGGFNPIDVQRTTAKLVAMGRRRKSRPPRPPRPPRPVR